MGAGMYPYRGLSQAGCIVNRELEALLLSRLVQVNTEVVCQWSQTQDCRYCSKEAHTAIVLLVSLNPE
jgi:hypothetical protein